MSLFERACSIIDKNGPEDLERLERWVRHNSFSANLDGVNCVVDLLIEDFAFAELTARRVRGEGTGDHVAWTSSAWESSSGRVLLVGHHDTVFPPGSFERYEVTPDRIHGPGTLDMKGGLLVVRAALSALASLGVLNRLPLGVVSVGDEEIGSKHSREFLRMLGQGARAGLVFESGRMNDAVVTARKGVGAFNVIATGKPAHAGNNHKSGINAIWGLAKLIDALQQLTDYDAGITVSVGTIEGGETRNSVPAQASCQVDYRYVQPGQHGALVEAIEQACKKITQATGVIFRVDHGSHRPPMERSASSLELFELYARRARSLGLGGDEASMVGGGSDANILSSIGVACIDGLGPRGQGFHTPDEFIIPATIALRAKALVATLMDLMPGAFEQPH